MKKYFISGIVILLPAAVTIWIISFIVHFLTQPFTSAVVKFLTNLQIHDLGFGFLSHDQIILYGSPIIILCMLVLFIILLGFIARSFFVDTLFKIGDFFIKKIPLINKFYKTSQEIVKTLFVTNKGSFKQVVLAPFPNPEVYCLGLVAREAPKTCNGDLDDELISVLVPTTPNPTTGFILLFKKQDLIFLNMKRDEAIKYIVSCGVVIPKKRELKEPLEKERG